MQYDNENRRMKVSNSELGWLRINVLVLEFFGKEDPDRHEEGA